MAIFGSKIYPKDRGGHCTNDKRKYDDDIGQERSGTCSRKRMMVLTWRGKRWNMFKEEDDGVDMDREEVGRSRAAPALTLRPHCPPTPGWCATASCVLPEHNYPE